MNDIKHRKALLLMALLAAALPAHTDEGRKLALVIANSRYQAIGSLKNPLADAKAVAERLKKAGFELLRPVRRDDVQAAAVIAPKTDGPRTLARRHVEPAGVRG